MYPASCTKIAFALYAIRFHEDKFQQQLAASRNALKTLPENQKSKDNFRVFPSYVLETDASHMGLKVGEEMTFYDLLEATMVVSADDASNVIAEVMGDGSIEKCVDDVNRYIASLGLTSTRFMNPHGLHHPEHVTTALDLANLAREAMKEPLFRKLAEAPRFQRPKTNKQEPVTLQATNRLLLKGSKLYYPPAIGIKTGYHRRAGSCLVAAADNEDRSLIAVILQGSNSEERFRDTTKLFHAAFKESKIKKTLLNAGPQTFTKAVEGGDTPIQTMTREPITHSFYPSDSPVTDCQLVWQRIQLPVELGAPVGQLVFKADGEVVQTVTLFAANRVEETLVHAFRRRRGPEIASGLVVLVGIGLLMFTRRRR